MSCARPERVRSFVKLVHDANICLGKLYSPRDDRIEHLIHIERGTHRSAHFSEGTQLLNRTSQLLSSPFQLVKQSGVLDLRSPPGRRTFGAWRSGAV